MRVVERVLEDPQPADLGPFPGRLGLQDRLRVLGHGMEGGRQSFADDDEVVIHEELGPGADREWLLAHAILSAAYWCDATRAVCQASGSREDNSHGAINRTPTLASDSLPRRTAESPSHHDRYGEGRGEAFTVLAARPR